MDEKFTDEDRLEFLQDAAKMSRTGLSLDYVLSIDGEKSGYRVMTFHNIGPPGATIRDAIDRAMVASGRWGTTEAKTRNAARPPRNHAGVSSA